MFSGTREDQRPPLVFDSELRSRKRRQLPVRGPEPDQDPTKSQSETAD